MLTLHIFVTQGLSTTTSRHQTVPSLHRLIKVPSKTYFFLNIIGVYDLEISVLEYFCFLNFVNLKEVEHFFWYFFFAVGCQVYSRIFEIQITDFIDLQMILFN
jgi:hypothetical protein